MMFARCKGSSKAKKGLAAPWQNGERKVDGGGPGSNRRQVVPETGMGNIDDDLIPARSFTSRTTRTTLPEPHNLPTLGALFKAEPLKSLSDLLQETVDNDDTVVEGPDDLSRDASFRVGEQANRCCVLQFARAY